MAKQVIMSDGASCENFANGEVPAADNLTYMDQNIQKPKCGSNSERGKGATKARKNHDGRGQKHSVVEKEVEKPVKSEHDVAKQGIMSDGPSSEIFTNSEVPATDSLTDVDEDIQKPKPGWKFENGTGTTKVHKNHSSHVQKHSVVEKQVDGEDDVVKQRVTPDRTCENFVNHDGGTYGEPITNQDNDYKSVETGNGVLDTAVVSEGTLGEHIKDCDHDNKSVDEMGEKGNSVGEKAVDGEDNVVKQGVLPDCPCENFANGDGGTSGEQITGNGFGETEWVSDGASAEQLKNHDDENKSVNEMAETGNSVGEKELDIGKQVIMSGGASDEQIPNPHDDNQSVDETLQMVNGVGKTEGVSGCALAEPIKNCDDNKSVDEMAEVEITVLLKKSLML